MNFKPGSTVDGSIPLWINGEETATQVTEPLYASKSEEILYSYSSASVDDCLRAVETAQRAYKTWSKTSVACRRDILLKASDLVDDKLRNEWLDTWLSETAETADPNFHIPMINWPHELLRDVAGRIAGAMSGVAPPSLNPEVSAIIAKEPYGVCLAMSPWNVPHGLAIRAVVFAIATGNTAVLKGSEITPKCFWQIGKMFKEAGLPDGVLNVVVSRRSDSADAVRKMIEHPAVRHVNFTGSSAIGRIVAGIAGQNLKPCLMELGGKASTIVMADADLDKAGGVAAASAFMHSGQVCMSTERIIVHESVAERFLDVFKRATDAFSPENGFVLANAGGVKKSYDLASEAVDQGAHIIHGNLNKPAKAGFRMNPIVLGGVQKGMELFYTESFGPHVSVYTFKNESEAIDLANDTEYGLTASIFSKNLGYAIQLAKQIESGAVHINSSTVGDDVNWPHGGYKSSGFGRFNGSYGMDAFLQYKNITWEG